MTDSNPQSISVVMPVRNAAPFLDQSIGSILNQSFRQFELVILDDASDDGSDVILERWKRTDSRIRLFRSERPLGVVGSSNRVISLARSPLIARMDGDDVSHPDRLARQFDVLCSDPDILAVGTLCDGIDAGGEQVRPRDRWRLLSQSQAPPFPHGSVMFRRSIFDRLGGYREACAGWEDQDLFLRIAARGRFVVLPEAFYSYRYHSASSTQEWDGGRRAQVMALREACLAFLRTGGDYGHLLASPPAVTRAAAGAAHRYDAGMRLWSGAPMGRFRLPRWLRRAVIRARDLAAGIFIRDGKVYRWRFA